MFCVENRRGKYLGGPGDDLLWVESRAQTAEGAPMPRLFPDGVRELEAPAFCEAFRRLGREDILRAGTGVAS
jgi:hypothetical protein